MEEKTFNGFASEAQYEAVRRAVKDCLESANIQYQCDELENDGFDVEKDTYSINVTLDDAPGLIIEMYGEGEGISLTLTRERHGRKEIDVEEMGWIMSLQYFDWDCYQVEE